MRICLLGLVVYSLMQLLSAETLLCRLRRWSLSFYNVRTLVAFFHPDFYFLADRTIGRAYGTVCLLSSVCLSVVCRL